MAQPPTETMGIPANHRHKAEITGENVTLGMRISDETTVGGFANTGREILVIRSEGATADRKVTIYTSATIGGYHAGDQEISLPDDDEFHLVGPFPKDLFGSRVIFDCEETTDTASSLRFAVWSNQHINS